MRGVVIGKLGDPLPKVRLDDLQPEVCVVLLQAPVELYLLGRHALGLGDNFGVPPPRQVGHVPHYVFPFSGKEDLATTLFDGVGHLLQVAVQVGHGLLLDAIRPLSQLRRLGQRVQDGVAARNGLLGEVLDGVVQTPVSYGPPAPLVEALYLARDALAAPVLGVAPSGGLLRLHRYPTPPSLESSI